MEAIRQVVDGQLLSGIISLPPYFENRKVEIIVIPIEEPAAKLSLKKNEIDAALSGSITETLIGAIPNSNKTLEEYRSERLKKHESAD